MARTSRTFYERTTKDAAFNNSENTQIKSKPPPAKPLPIRYQGVRMVKGHVSHIITLGNYSKISHGIANEIVSNLVNKEPLLLAQILSTRYLVHGMAPSDYIVALAQSKIDNDTGLRKRTRDDICYSVSDSSTDVANLTDSMSNCHNLLIHESEIDYLKQVLEEDASLEKKRHLKSTFTSTHFNERDDDLLWLTKEMEHDWEKFLLMTGFTRNQNSQKAPVRSSHPYKAYLSLGKRTQCDLGHYHAADDAALVYDKYAISRRTLGIKLAQFSFLYRRVKALKATHEESIRLTSLNDPTISAFDIVLRCQESATKAVEYVSKLNDSYFSSDKVLYPILNSFPNSSWRLVYPFPFRLDATMTLEINRVMSKENDALQLIQQTNKQLLSDPPPVDWLNAVVHEMSGTEEMLNLENNVGICEIGKNIASLENSLSSLLNDIFCQIISFNRLFKLEKQIQPLLLADVTSQAEYIQQFESGCTQKKNGSSMKIYK
jgi:hypothetical protein